MICGSLRRPSPKGKPLAIPALGLCWLFGLLCQEAAQAGERALDLGGGVGMRLVWIPPGEFVMGGARPLPHQPGGRQVRVRLTRGFYLGATEITQEQWTAVMGSRPWAGRPHVVEDPARPAVFLSWTDLQLFTGRLTARSGERVRLPTEAEWEYACRSGGEPAASGTAWYHDNAFADPPAAARAVALKPPDSLGLYDMRGNVWEWVADWYSPGYGLRGRLGVVVDPRGPERGRHRVKRGGSFYDFAESVHCGARDGYSEPGRYVNIGARVLVEP